MDAIFIFFKSYWGTIFIIITAVVGVAIVLLQSKKEFIHEGDRPILKKFKRKSLVLFLLIIIGGGITVYQNLREQKENTCLLEKVSRVDSTNQVLETQNKEILDTLKSLGFGIRKETGKIRPLKDADVQLCPGIDAAEITPSKLDSFYVSFSLCNKGEIDAHKLRVQIIFIYKHEGSHKATKPVIVPLQEDEVIYTDNPKQVIGTFGAKGWTLEQMVGNVLLYLKVDYIGKSELKTIRKVISCENINGIKWINVVGDTYELAKEILTTQGNW